MPNASGYLVDLRIRRKKSGSYAELVLMSENGYRIIRDPLSSEFWVEPRSEAAERAMEHLGPKTELFSPEGLIEVHKVEFDPYDRANVRREIKGISRRKKLHGAHRPFEIDYFIRRGFRPYDALTTENGLQRTTLSYALHPTACTFDTETDGLADPKNPKEILCIGITHVGAKDTKVYLSPEPELLENASRHMSNFYMIFTWGGDNYDWPCFEGRAKHHGLMMGRAGIVSKKRIGTNKVSAYRIFGRQNIDLITIVPRLYDMPTKSQDSAIRVFLGKEPIYMEKSNLKRLAESHDPALEDLVRRDAENLADICRTIGFLQALIEISRTVGIPPEILTRISFSDSANFLVENLAYQNRGILDDKRTSIRPTSLLPFEGMSQYGVIKFEYPPKNVRSLIGHYRGPLFKIDKKIIYPRIIISRKQRFGSGSEMPMVWAAERIEKEVKRNASDGTPSQRTTISRFLKEVGFHLPTLLGDQKYPWFNRYLWGMVESEMQAYMRGGLWNDWEYMFDCDVPDFAAHSDIERVDGLIVFDGGYVYAKNGLPFARGIKLSDPNDYVEDSLREVLAAAVTYGKDGLVEKFRERADRELMGEEHDKLLRRYSKRTERQIRILEGEHRLRIRVGIDYEQVAQTIANRLEPVARVFGMDARSLLHSAQPQQLALI